MVLHGPGAGPTHKRSPCPVNEQPPMQKPCTCTLTKCIARRSLTQFWPTAKNSWQSQPLRKYTYIYENDTFKNRLRTVQTVDTLIYTRMFDRRYMKLNETPKSLTKFTRGISQVLDIKGKQTGKCVYFTRLWFNLPVNTHLSMGKNTCNPSKYAFLHQSFNQGSLHDNIYHLPNSCKTPVTGENTDKDGRSKFMH